MPTMSDRSPAKHHEIEWFFCTTEAKGRNNTIVLKRIRYGFFAPKGTANDVFSARTGGRHQPLGWTGQLRRGCHQVATSGHPIFSRESRHTCNVLLGRDFNIPPLRPLKCISSAWQRATWIGRWPRLAKMHRGTRESKSCGREYSDVMATRQTRVSCGRARHHPIKERRPRLPRWLTEHDLRGRY